MERLSDDFLYELVQYTLENKENFDLVFSELGWNLDYVGSKEVKRLLLEIRKYRNKKNKVPNINYLESKFTRNEEVSDFLDELRTYSRSNPIDEESTVSTLEEFIRRTRFANLYREMGEAYNDGNQQKAFDIFEIGTQKITNFTFSRNRVEEIFGGFDNRMTSRIMDANTELDFRIPFCVEQMNYYTQGGGEAGEFYMALGDTGTGKSIFLVSNGVEAARRGYNVLHVQAEGTKKQIEQRYDSCWTGLTSNQLKHIADMPQDEWEERTTKYDRVIRSVSGEIYVESFTSFEERPKVAQVRELLKNFRKRGIKIHLVLLDYLELFDPLTNRWEDETQRQGFVARNFKDIAVEFNCVVGTVTQMQRVDKDAKNSPDWVAERDNIGGAYEKVRPTDLFFTFNQTKDEKKKGIARVFFDKGREHDSKMIFSVYQDLGRSRFVNRLKTRKGFFDPRSSKKKS